MNRTVRDYVERATEGLRDDAELRLDVEAELETHIEDRAAELESEGKSGTDAADEAIRRFGDLTDIAGEIASGNRGRLAWRGRIRALLRFAVVPLAVLAAFMCSDLQWLRVIQFSSPSAPARLSQSLVQDWFRGRELPAVLRATPEELWLSEPQNPVYYGNLVTYEVAGRRTPDNTAPVADELAILDQAREIDPGNARYDYLRASILLNDACKIDTEKAGTNPDGTPRHRLVWNVTDRDRLDAAMIDLLKGMDKNEYKRYGREMLQQKLDALGEPDRYATYLQRVTLSASTLLPDLQHIRQLARAGMLYARTRIEEGKVESALPYLESWKRLALHLNSDAWTLIDCLVVSAVVQGVSEEAADLCQSIGRPEDAERVRREARLLSAPVTEWKAKREAHETPKAGKQDEAELRRYGSVMAQLLMPALAEWPAPEAYAPGRRLEYTILMEAVTSLASFFLLGAMTLCLVVALRWRFAAGGRAIPILLVPGWRLVCRIVLLCILLPLAVFFVFTRVVPWSGFQFSYQVAGYRTLTEVALLLAALLLLPGCLAGRWAAKRCRDLRIEVRALSARWLLWGVGAAVALASVAWVVPLPTGQTPAFPPVLLAPALCLIGLCGAVWVASFLQGAFGSRQAGLFYGTLARSVLPILAFGVIVISVTTRPWLLHRERQLMKADEIIVDVSGKPGITKMETELTEEMVHAVKRAAEHIQ